MISIIIVFVLCFISERLVPGWRLPAVRGWVRRVVAINAVQLAVVLIAGTLWERWARLASVWHLGRSHSPWTGGLLAYFVATFIFYWWHRVRHESDWLWVAFKAQVARSDGTPVLVLARRRG